MKRRILKTFCLIITAFLIFSSVFATECFAAIKKGPVIDITVYPIDSSEYVCVDIAFTENPGIGAMTFTLLYDNTTFSASPYDVRYFYRVLDTSIRKYLIVDHPNEGYVSVVWSPEGNAKLYTGTGIAFRMTFHIDKQISGKHPFEIGNIQPVTRGKDLAGCFSDFEHNTFSPVINADAYIIGGDDNIPNTYRWKDKIDEPKEDAPEVSEEHSHNYVLHKKVSPSCLADGYSIYECSVCGEKQTKDKVSALGHSFNDFWTVDRIATASVAMKISRHCSRCDATTDIYYYTLENAQKLNIKNVLGTKVYENSESGIVKKPVSKTGKDSTAKTSEETDAEITEEIGNIKNEIPIDPETVKNAEELIESAKEEAESHTPTGKVKKVYGFFEKLYMYLIGTAEKPGILRIIIEAIIRLFK